jgi:hypothetical protein
MNHAFGKRDHHARDHSGDRLRAIDGRAAFVANAVVDPASEFLDDLAAK